MQRFILIVGSAILILLALLAGYIASHQVADKPVAELAKRWAQPPSQFLDIAGMQIHLRDQGDKNAALPIVLLHGTSASLHTWDGWTEQLTPKQRVIRFDLPAFGLTGPDPTNNYQIERYAEVVIAVLDKLDINQAIIAGNSLGGYIAWATAVLHPNRVAKLILVDASGLPFESESTPLAFKIASNPLASALLKDFLPDFVVTNSVKNVYGNPNLVSQELVERYYQLALREGNRAALQQRFTQTQPGSLAEQVTQLTQPTLIIWGGKDRLIPLSVGQRFNQLIPISQLQVFEQLGHVPHEEDPLSTVIAVKEFLLSSQ